MLVEGLILDSSDVTPMHRQLYDGVRKMVLSGVLPGGARMPSSRMLAPRLGVSRFTVVTAMDQLIAEGYLKAISGSGTFVEIFSTASAHRDHDTSLRQAINKDTFQLSDKAQKLHWVPSMVSNKGVQFLHMGSPDPRLFPKKAWSRTARNVLNQLDIGLAWSRDFDEPTSLERQIASQVAISRGITCEPEEVVTTFGAHHAVNLITELLLNSGDAVAFEQPGMPAVRSIFKTYGCDVFPLIVDEHGANPVSVRNHPIRLAFVTAAKQQPLIVPMSVGRKLEMINWSKETASIIVEDDLGSEFRYEGSPIPPLKAMDTEGRVIYIGSFGMSLLQTLRIGYMIMPKKLATICRRMIQVQFRHMPLLTEHTLACFIEDGHFSRHIHRVRRIYEKRQQTLLSILCRDFVEFFEPPVFGGGFYNLCYFRDQNVDEDQITAQCSKKELGVEQLSYYYENRSSPKKGLLIGFAANTDEEIEAGMKILYDIMANNT